MKLFFPFIVLLCLFSCHTTKPVGGSANSITTSVTAAQTPNAISQPVSLQTGAVSFTGPVFDSLTFRQDYYQTAFASITAMLEGRKNNSFKHAVFAVENAYCAGRLAYNSYNQQILQLFSLARIYKQAHQDDFDYPFPDRDTILTHASLFEVMKDTIRLGFDELQLLHLPMTYRFEDFNGAQSWEHTFVSSLLQTGQGNCQSLAYLYKILADESGVESHLALAPQHLYIKRSSKKIGMYNTELTNGTFPTDAWMMASGYITLEAVQNGLYMQPLTNKQSLALCLLDLAKGYEKQFGSADGTFMLNCCNTALSYYPNCINAQLLKARVLETQLQQNYSLQVETEHQQLIVAIHHSGYRQMPEAVYLNWLTGTAMPTPPVQTTSYQPFAGFGKRQQVNSSATLTLSKGSYAEFLTTETAFVQIGNALLNTRTMNVEGFEQEQSFRIDPETALRFSAVDPLAGKYPHNSPYAFSENRVVDGIELEGLEVVDADEANVKKSLTVKKVIRKEVVAIQITYSSSAFNQTAYLSKAKMTESQLLIAGQHYITPNVWRLNYAFFNGDSYSDQGVEENTDDINSAFSYTVAKSDSKKENLPNISRDGVGNSFRHFTMSVVVSSMFGQTWGKVIMDAHESYPNDPKTMTTDTQIDLINNELGFAYAKENNIDINAVLKDDNATADFLNKLAIHVLKSDPVYKNDKTFKAYINGKKKIFSADQEGVQHFREQLLEIYNSNPLFVIQ